MAAEDVARALMAMDDAEVRRRVAAGDFRALGTLDLTSQERALVGGATAVLPDGHPSKVFVRLGAGEVDAHAKRDDDSGFWPAGTADAIRYVDEGLADPRVQAQFRGWVRSALDRIP